MSHTAETVRGTARQGLDADLRVPVDPQTIERPGPEPGFAATSWQMLELPLGPMLPFQGCEFVLAGFLSLSPNRVG